MESSVAFLQYIVENLVEDTNSIKIERTEDERGTLLSLSVAASDMGKIIGKDGKIVQALRTLLKMIGAKTHEKVTLRVIEPV